MTNYNAEFLHLPRAPSSAEEARRKLEALEELARRMDPRDRFLRDLRPLSKRRARLVKTYWAYRQGKVVSNS